MQGFIRLDSLMPLTETIGAATLDGLAYVGGLARLIGGAIRAVFILPFQGKKFHVGRALHQAMSVGVEALPITSLISFFVGTILAVNAAYELRKLGALHFVAGGVAIAISAAVGCQEGFSTGLGSEQVGRSTTSAVVKSIFMVVMVDLIFTTIFYVTSPR